MFEHLTSRDLLSAVGSILEILGAIAMANAYLGAARRRHWAMVLVSALGRGKLARGAIEAREINKENSVLALQGLAWITLGFLCQMIAILFL